MTNSPSLLQQMTISINVLPSFAQFATPAEQTLVSECLPEIIAYAKSINAENVRVAKHKFGKTGRIAMFQFTTKTGKMIASRVFNSIFNSSSAPEQKPAPEVRITTTPTFEKFGSKFEEFVINRSTKEIENHARELGADRVFVTKNLTKGRRPLMLRFMNKSTFVKNNSVNTVLSA